jgi:di/tricarboxylate transporter
MAEVPLRGSLHPTTWGTTVSEQLVSILVLLAVFLIATVLPVHMGALALVATFILGFFLFQDPADSGAYADTIFGFFPGSLFVILVGVTYLFAIAKNNGTVDWLVHAAVTAAGGRLVAIPWAMFAVTAALTAIGGVVPAVVAIIAPVGMQFARRYGINPVLMGLFIINGATAGGFSPLSIFGSITNTVVADNDLPGSPIFLWVASIVANVLLSIAVFFIFGGRKMLGGVRAADLDVTRDGGDGGAGAQRVAVGSTSTGGAAVSSSTGPAAGSPAGNPRHGQPGHTHDQAEERAEDLAIQTTAIKQDEPTGPVTTLDRDRILTLVGLAVLVVGALLPLDLDIGLMAITVGVILSVIAPRGAKGAVGQIAWPTVLLICGIVTYVGLMQEIGTPDWLGENVAALGVPMLAALLICYIGAVVSAFASTTGILGALIPLAVPFLLGSESIGAIGLITALALSSSIVDSSPFSTSGALVVANSQENERDRVFKQLTVWGFSMVAIIPLVTWLVLVVPGWL